MENNFFKYKKLNKDKLLKSGFSEKSGIFVCSFLIMNGDFSVEVEISYPNIVKTRTIEKETNEPYTLHLTNEQGSFVGQVRDEYEKVLSDISENCFEDDVFKSNQAKELISYISEKYGDELEFLWEKFPDCAIIRRSDNKKWYFLIMTISKSKFDFESDETVEIIDLRAIPDDIPTLLKQGNIYPGYHMNKKHWITIILDESMPSVEIYELLDKSYKLAKK